MLYAIPALALMSLLAILQAMCFFQLALEQACIFGDQLERASITKFVQKSKHSSQAKLIAQRSEIDRQRRYWMPYMDMSARSRNIIAFILYVVTLVILVQQRWIDFLINLLGATTMPFITFVIPGILIYQHNLHEEEGSKLEIFFSLSFASIGFLSILFYTSTTFHSLSLTPTLP